jgi:hypothetical protein
MGCGCKKTQAQAPVKQVNKSRAAVVITQQQQRPTVRRTIVHPVNR